MTRNVRPPTRSGSPRSRGCRTSRSRCTRARSTSQAVISYFLAPERWAFPALPALRFAPAFAPPAEPPLAEAAPVRLALLRLAAFEALLAAAFAPRFDAAFLAAACPPALFDAAALPDPFDAFFDALFAPAPEARREPELRFVAVARREPCRVERLDPDRAPRATNLKKRLVWPDPIWSWWSRARSLSSKMRKNSSHEVSSSFSSSSPKSKRRMPPRPRPVRTT